MNAWSVDGDARAEDLEGGGGMALSARAGWGEARNDWVRVVRVRGEPQGAKALEELRVAVSRFMFHDRTDLCHGSLYPMTFSYLASRPVILDDLTPCTITPSCGAVLTISQDPEY